MRVRHTRPSPTIMPTTNMLITYVAGPFPDDRKNRLLEEGEKWMAQHGTSGGKAAPAANNRRMRRMVKMAHHRTLGAFFLNHPPLCRFRVDVADLSHPL